MNEGEAQGSQEERLTHDDLEMEARKIENKRSELMIGFEVLTYWVDWAKTLSIAAFYLGGAYLFYKIATSGITLHWSIT